MKNTAQFLLSAAFAAGVCLTDTAQLRAQTPQAKVWYNKSEIKTSLENLERNGQAFDPRMLAGKYLLIYFGTAYETPSCDSFFDRQATLLKNLESWCSAIGGEIQPVFICPYPVRNTDKTAKNRALANGYIVLEAKLEDIVALGRTYRVQYLGKPGQDPYTHSNLVFLQNPGGDNVLILNGNNFAGESATYIYNALKKTGYDRDPR